MTANDTIVIRRAGAADARVLTRLAALDSAPVPGDGSLLAEVDGVAVAALDPRDGRVVADPFARTADLVALLELRAGRLREAARGRSARPLRLHRRAARLAA
jgi:hypothetical protein